MNKYYRFDIDLCWGVEDSLIGIVLAEAHKNNEKEEFINVFNGYYSSIAPFKIVKIYEMHGPGGGWPFVQIETTKKLSEKQFLKYIIELWDSDVVSIEEMRETYSLEEFDEK